MNFWVPLPWIADSGSPNFFQNCVGINNTLFLSYLSCHRETRESKEYFNGNQKICKIRFLGCMTDSKMYQKWATESKFKKIWKWKKTWEYICKMQVCLRLCHGICKMNECMTELCNRNCLWCCKLGLDFWYIPY